MHYKSLSLAALLLPFSGYGINKNEARIIELKEARFKKFAEIKNLGDAIIGYYRDNDDVMKSCVTKTFDKEKNHSPTQESASAVILKEFEKCTLGRKFEKAYEASEPFNYNIQEEIMSARQYCELHFVDLQFVVTYHFISLHLDKYDQLLKELLAINRELTLLETK